MVQQFKNNPKTTIVALVVAGVLGMVYLGKIDTQSAVALLGALSAMGFAFAADGKKGD